MVPLLHVNALVMPLQICLPYKLLAAIVYGTWKRILSTRIMRFHMGLEVVAPTEKLATSTDTALEVGILLGGKFSRLSRTCYGTRTTVLTLDS